MKENVERILNNAMICGMVVLSIFLYLSSAYVATYVGQQARGRHHRLETCTACHGAKELCNN